MSDFESAIQTAVDTKDIPGCVLGAKNRDGTFNYSKSFGSSSMDPERAKPLSPDTVMWVASCTKLMTSIAAMQLVERGLVSLDEPVYKHIPELESFNVLKGFEEDGKPIEEKHTKPITLKLLLTHSSGLSYDFVNPKLAAWAAYKKVRLPVASKKLLERFNLPLVFEPGEGWMYGPSIDYAGLLVERITGKSLEEYLRENLWEPLGVKDVTFRLGTRPDMKARMADMSERDESGKVTFSKAPLMYVDDDRIEDSDCLGGQGSLTTAGEYLKILDALLNAETDERILKKESVETFFSPHLGDKSSAMLNAILQDDMAGFLHPWALRGMSMLMTSNRQATLWAV
jgi:CubicO group peptidase (beta-lactamase class C family)